MGFNEQNSDGRNFESDADIRIAGVIEESIVDGPGIRYVVFTQGCPHRCPGCHNPKTHDYSGGTIISARILLDKIKKNPLLDGLTLSGGEPFEQAASCAILAKEVKKTGLNVITYTGYLFEDLFNKAQYDQGISDLLNNTDILIDGPFDMEKRDILLKFRGSGNQRVIDMKETLAAYPENKEIIIKEL